MSAGAQGGKRHWKPWSWSYRCVDSMGAGNQTLRSSSGSVRTLTCSVISPAPPLTVLTVCIQYSVLISINKNTLKLKLRIIFTEKICGVFHFRGYLLKLLCSTCLFTALPPGGRVLHCSLMSQSFSIPSLCPHLQRNRMEGTVSCWVTSPILRFWCQGVPSL